MVISLFCFSRTKDNAITITKYNFMMMAESNVRYQVSVYPSPEKGAYTLL
ncbi:hypothetical protein HMPREF3226_01964 [Prevotella corporis]|uniref:Uncharacterized protein n=1 Tax=Prevotella corporis TaxID=28128 RepID=A0A133PZ56_9BACT|nr:hypothetical protein HMPREF3226_01964 [Prevotella corporis]